MTPSALKGHFDPELHTKGGVKTSIAVGALMVRDNKVLLAKRANTGYADDFYAMIGGSVEPQETLQMAIVREIEEEVGIVAPLDSLRCIHVVHVRKSPSQHLIMANFALENWTGTPVNREPKKCSDLHYFSLSNIDSVTWITPVSRQAIAALLQKGPFYTECGWQGPDEQSLLESIRQQGGRSLNY